MCICKFMHSRCLLVVPAGTGFNDNLNLLSGIYIALC